MKLFQFNSVYTEANTLYNCKLDPTIFEDIALDGWEKIGNKQTRLYKYITNTINSRIKLPCNVDLIEAVYSDEIEAQSSTPLSPYQDLSKQFAEEYTESWKNNTKLLYNKGKLVSYKLEGDELVFNKDYNSITIIYYGIIVDDEGLPLLTSKEVRALAAYCAYVDLYRDGLSRRDGNILQIAGMVKLDWIRYCSDAHVPDMLSQNELNDILDVNTRWDRKVFNKSFKSII